MRVLNSDLFLWEKGSDFAMRFGGRLFHLHSAVVCPQSKLLRCIFDQHINPCGASKALVTLPEDDACIMGRFLCFLYTGDYNDNTIFNSWNKPDPTALLDDDAVERHLREPNVEDMYKRITTSDSPFDCKDNPGYMGCIKRAEKSLDNTLRIHGLAKEFDVPRLQLLTRDRAVVAFYHLVKHGRENTCNTNRVVNILVYGVRHAMASMPKIDTGVWPFIIKIVAEVWWKADAFVERLLPILLERPDLCASIADAAGIEGLFQYRRSKKTFSLALLTKLVSITMAFGRRSATEAVIAWDKPPKELAAAGRPHCLCKALSTTADWVRIGTRCSGEVGAHRWIGRRKAQRQA
ncbi:BTB/POZ domain-containing protein [Seiridium cupressi]